MFPVRCRLLRGRNRSGKVPLSCGARGILTIIRYYGGSRRSRSGGRRSTRRRLSEVEVGIESRGDKSRQCDLGCECRLVGPAAYDGGDVLAS